MWVNVLSVFYRSHELVFFRALPAFLARAIRTQADRAWNDIVTVAVVVLV